MRRIEYLMVVLALVACSKEKQAPEENLPSGNDKIVSLTAHAPQDVKVSASYSEGTYSLHWEASEQISVFDGTGNVAFTAEGSGDAVVFKGTPSATPATWYALSPYTSGATLAGSTISTSIPAAQAVAQGLSSFPIVAAAKTSGTNLDFTNVASVIKLSFAAEAAGTVTQVVISGRNDENIAGDVTIDCSGVSPVISAGDAKTITVTPSGSATFAEGDYFVKILPVNLTSGITLTFTRSDAQVIEKSSSKAADLSTPGVLAIAIPVVRTEIEKIESILTSVGNWEVDHFIEDWGDPVDVSPSIYYCGDGDYLKFLPGGEMKLYPGSNADSQHFASGQKTGLPTLIDASWHVSDNGTGMIMTFADEGYPLAWCVSKTEEYHISNYSSSSITLTRRIDEWDASYSIVFKPYEGEEIDWPIIRHTFVEGDFDIVNTMHEWGLEGVESVSPQVINGVTWTLSHTCDGAHYWQFNETSDADWALGIQIGLIASPPNVVTLSSSGLNKDISKITLGWNALPAATFTVAAQVGGNAFGTPTTEKGEAVFTGSATGDIVITLTQSESAREVYLTSISVE